MFIVRARMRENYKDSHATLWLVFRLQQRVGAEKGGRQRNVCAMFRCLCAFLIFECGLSAILRKERITEKKDSMENSGIRSNYCAFRLFQGISPEKQKVKKDTCF